MTKAKRSDSFQRLAILLVLIALLVPSGGVLVSKKAAGTDTLSAPQSTPAPANIQPGSYDVPAAQPTPAPSQRQFLLPVYDFSCGNTPKPECYNGDSYSDDTISVRLWREELDGSVYNCCEVVIADPSQLRCALGGTIDHAHSVRFSKRCARNHLVVARNGECYNHREGSYIVKQSQLLQDTNTSILDLLIIDYNGDMKIYSVDEKVRGVAENQGNIYQAISFGPALVRDGVMQLPPEGYIGDPKRDNPRAALGQLGPLHYLLVVVDGRTDYSKGIDTTTLAAFMKSKNCLQAYALDGGASASIYFNGENYNHGSDTGERSMYDIIYFASAA